MNTIINFTQEIRSFSKNNWWIYIIYLIMLSLIYQFRNSELLSVYIVSSLHFCADIFIMMMLAAYTRKDYRDGAYFQLVSFLLFLSIKIYTGLSVGAWHYLLADPLYALAALKNYFKDVKNINLGFINTKSMIVLSLAILILLASMKNMNGERMMATPAECIQTLGIFLFAIALSTTTNEHLRHHLSMIALAAMVIGSGWQLADCWQDPQRRIVGLDISYFLLPSTVLTYYIRQTPFIRKRVPQKSF